MAQGKRGVVEEYQEWVNNMTAQKHDMAPVGGGASAGDWNYATTSVGNAGASITDVSLYIPSTSYTASGLVTR